MSFRFLPVLFWFCLFTLHIGCGIVKHPKKYFTEDFNLAGAISHENDSFSPVATGTIHLQSEEIIDRKHFSGSKTSFLWGLFTFTDY